MALRLWRVHRLESTHEYAAHPYCYTTFFSCLPPTPCRYRLESTLNYGMERVWAVGYAKGHNSIAIGWVG